MTDKQPSRAAEIVAAATQLVAEKEAAGWTRQDFCNGLQQMLASPTGDIVMSDQTQKPLTLNELISAFQQADKLATKTLNLQADAFELIHALLGAQIAELQELSYCGHDAPDYGERLGHILAELKDLHNRIPRPGVRRGLE